jgi:amino acid transporter
MEIVGSVQGLVQWMQHEPLITGSPYFDQLLFSAVSLLIVLLIALMPKSVSSRVAVVFLIVLVFAFASMLLGLAVSGETGADPIIQPSLETLQSNLLPAGELLNFSDTLSIMLPCFIGLYSGVSNAHHLRWPAKSIPLGGFSSIGLSASLYCCLCSLFALCVPRELLQHDIMIGVRSAVPWPGLVIAGVYIVGLGASLQCALTASAVLASLMDRQLLAPCRPLDGQSPHRPILLVVLFASPMVLLTDLEFLAKLTALCFCLNYGSTNIACSLLSAFKSPVWRPQFQISWQWSLIGALLCLFCMLAINTYAAFLSVLVLVFNFIQSNDLFRV